MTTAYPLAWPEGWPRTPAHRRRSRYAIRTTFGAAREQLYDEMRRLGARSCVISCNLALNLDGSHNARGADAVLIADPGVAIYFELRHRPMVIASDRYETIAANLRSVGLAIEHLRGLERHGGGHMMERAFGGFSALPPPKHDGTPAERPWREVLGPIPDGLDKADALVIAESRYRAKARTTHADAGGSNEAMIVLNAAIARAREELA